MNFEEINEQLGFTLTEESIEGFSENQQTIFKKVKSGKSILLNSPISNDLDLALELISFSKAPDQLEGSPRVLWLTPTIDRAHQLLKQFKIRFRKTEITPELAVNKGKMIEQRNLIFDGCEILIGNPKRIIELYNQNGFHVNQLKLLIIDDFESICKDIAASTAIRRLAESLPPCQKFIQFQKEHSRQKEILEIICPFYEEIVI